MYAFQKPTNNGKTKKKEEITSLISFRFIIHIQASNLGKQMFHLFLFCQTLLLHN
jgi:hypothetical protein